MFTSLRARFTARFARTMMFVGAAGLALGTAACTTDGPTGLSSEVASLNKSAGRGGAVTPSASPSATEVTALSWTKPVRELTASAVIGSEGGELRIASGMRLIVPAGAVSEKTTFRVTQIAGAIVAYDFEPHGITFAVPLILQQPVAGTNFNGGSAGEVVRGAYFKDVLQLNQATRRARVDEFRPTLISADKKWIQFTIDHFSGYMVAMD